ncbi:hypothetical protein [Mycolicibacillus koreensis]|uniref:hypothetical protein n=1 Tax=Mycolicibacillus koreensis TaxID=1069220 RepID=UPI001F453398|nr:hypothetical protein [Mycolicibacillus koreensis]
MGAQTFRSLALSLAVVTGFARSLEEAVGVGVGTLYTEARNGDDVVCDRRGADASLVADLALVIRTLQHAPPNGV